MFDLLRRYFIDRDDRRSRANFAEDDPRLAVAVLMVHVIAADGVVTPHERKRLEEELSRRYDLTPAQAAELEEAARQAERETAALQSYTAGLQRRLPQQERREIVSSLWRMVFADGQMHEFEDNVVWRIADLLGVAPHERVALRKEIEADEEARRASEDERP